MDTKNNNSIKDDKMQKTLEATKNILQAFLQSNEACSSESVADDDADDGSLVRYGRSTVKKGTEEYYDMRKRNNDSIKIHRKGKKLESLKNSNGEIVKKIEEQIKVYDTLRNIFLNEILSNEENCKIDAQIQILINEFKNL
jgi:hypothetical protein